MTATNMGNWLKSEMEYGRDLADSGWQGARTAWDTVLQTEPVSKLLSRSVRASWAPTAMGIGVGALCALLVQRRKANPAGRRGPGRRRRRRRLHRLCRLGNPPDLLRGRPRRDARDQLHPRLPLARQTPHQLRLIACQSSAHPTGEPPLSGFALALLKSLLLFLFLFMRCHPERSEGPHRRSNLLCRRRGFRPTLAGAPFKPSFGLGGAVDLRS